MCANKLILTVLYTNFFFISELNHSLYIKNFKVWIWINSITFNTWWICFFLCLKGQVVVYIHAWTFHYMKKSLIIVFFFSHSYWHVYVLKLNLIIYILHTVFCHNKCYTWHELKGAREKGNQGQWKNWKGDSQWIVNPIHANSCSECRTEQNDKIVNR